MMVMVVMVFVSLVFEVIAVTTRWGRWCPVSGRWRRVERNGWGRRLVVTHPGWRRWGRYVYRNAGHVNANGNAYIARVSAATCGCSQ